MVGCVIQYLIPSPRYNCRHVILCFFSSFISFCRSVISFGQGCSPVGTTYLLCVDWLACWRLRVVGCLSNDVIEKVLSRHLFSPCSQLVFVFSTLWWSVVFNLSCWNCEGKLIYSKWTMKVNLPPREKRVGWWIVSNIRYFFFFCVCVPSYLPIRQWRHKLEPVKYTTADIRLKSHSCLERCITDYGREAQQEHRGDFIPS